MTLPSSDRFDIVDFTYRAASHGEGQTLEDGSIFGSAFVQHGNVLQDGDGLVFSADTDIVVAKSVVSSMVIEDALEYVDGSGVAGNGIPSSFTFEFDITLTDEIPKDFTNTDNRLFVGAMNQQGYSAGLLFSHQGIALADSPEDKFPTYLGGSINTLIDKTKGGVFYNEGTNFRVIVNGELGRVTVYASPSKEAYDSGSGETNAEVIFSAEAKPTKSTMGDCILIHGSGDSVAMQASKAMGAEFTEEDQGVLFALRSLRLSSTRLIPEDAPIAVVDGPQFITVGGVSNFSGIQSYDPEGKEISYNWEIEVAPTGSTASLSGSKNSYANIKVTSPYDGSLVDVVRITREKATAVANDYVVYLVMGEPGGHLGMEFDELTGELTVTLEVDDDGNVKTTATGLVSAFTDKLSSGYNILVSGGVDLETGVEYPTLFRAGLVLIETAGDEALEPGNFLFQGGTGSDLSDPTLVADKEGLYIVSLQVGNGARKSRVARTTCTASFTAQLLGHRPHSKYVFKYISDFWKLVKDKEQVESIWSSLTQVLSNELLQTWQNDYAKSLRDVSRKYQRRWLSHETRIDLDGTEVKTKLVHDDHSVKGLTIPHVDSGVGSKIADSLDMWGSKKIAPGLKLIMSSIGKPYVVDVVSVDALLVEAGETTVEEELEHHCEGIPGMVIGTETKTETLYEETGYYRLTAAGDDFKKYSVISERSSGYFVIDPEDPDATSPIFSSVLTDKTYPLFQVDTDRDLMRVHVEDQTKFANIVERDVKGKSNTARLEDLSGILFNEHVNGLAVYWDHLNEASNVFVHSTPYIMVSNSILVQSLDLIYGDLVQVSFIDPYTSMAEKLNLTLLATHQNSLFVRWETLLDHLNNQAIKYNDDAVYDHESISSLGLQVDAFLRTRVLEKVPDLVSAPALGFNTIVPEFGEGVDYSVIDGTVTINDYFVGQLSTVAESAVVKFNSGYRRHPELDDAGFDILALFAAGVHSIQIETGADAGLYRIQAIDEDTGELTLESKMTASSDACVFRSPRFSVYSSPKGKLWAEISYFDNWQSIENNFGLFVGLPKDLVDNYDDELDYLSVIRSMWFAFLSGPSFDNVSLAVQALFGLPYSEIKSQLTYHEEATPEKDGVLTLVSESSQTFTYTYPYGAVLGVNPRTGRQIKAFTPVPLDEIPLLSEELTQNLEDSVIDAYVRLVDVVRVEDYISDPEIIENVMTRNDYTYLDDNNDTHVVDLPPSIIQKYHTFLVDVPLTVTGGTEVFPLVSDFLQEAKPAYTNFILQGSILLIDEINVVDEPFYYPTLLLKDTPHTAPFFATKTDEDKFGRPVVNPDQELLIWPVEKTYEKHDIDFSPLIDASYFCLSGPYFLHDDIFAGNSYLYFDESVIGTDNLGTIAADGTHTYHPIIAEVLKAYHTGGGIAIAVPHTPDFEFFTIHSIGLTTAADPMNPGAQIMHKLELGLYDETGVAVKLPTGALAPYNPMNCLFFDGDNWLPPMPVIDYWDDEDVKEKYESGYCEGVLDDYSGDGSWNMRRSQLDMVNTVNPDLDIVRSKLWCRVHYQHTVFGRREISPLQLGETVSICDESGNPIADNIWDEAPPVITHIGYGEPVKLPYLPHPFSGKDGLKTHVHTYVILGFEVPRGDINSVEDSDAYDYEAVGLNNYGHESRLTAIHDMINEFDGPGSRICIKGNTSGTVMDLWDVNMAYDVQPFTETIWQVDKLIEYGPVSDPTFTLTTYFPVDEAGHAPGDYPLGHNTPGSGGITLTDFKALSRTFDKDVDDTAKKYAYELETRATEVWPVLNESEWLLPSFNPGIFTAWDTAASGTTPDEAKVVYEVVNSSTPLNTVPVAPDAWEMSANWETRYLQNVHVGMTLSARKEQHITHGFTNFRIPAPSIRMILPSSAGYDLRICGFYFCDDDPSRVVLPTSDPESFGNPGSNNGVIGGGWVFFRDSETLEEFADVNWNFETGSHAGFPILPQEPLRDGTPTFIVGSADQRSDGHIIECHIPDVPEDRYYDIIIRNYRPYLEPKHGQEFDAHDPEINHVWKYHMDETVALRAYYHSPGGLGGITWGIDPFGTGGA